MPSFLVLAGKCHTLLSGLPTHTQAFASVEMHLMLQAERSLVQSGSAHSEGRGLGPLPKAEPSERYSPLVSSDTVNAVSISHMCAPHPWSDRTSR